MKKPDQDTTCAWAQQLIDAYLDGDLTAAETSRLEAHLSGCFTCSEELALAKRVKQTLKSFPQQHCPDRVIDAALKEIGDKTPVAEQRRPWAWGSRRYARVWRFAAVATACITLVIVALILKPPQQPVTQVSSEELIRAEKEVKLTLAYLGYVSYRSTVTVCDDVLETRIVPPMKRAFTEALDIKAMMPFKYLKI